MLQKDYFERHLDQLGKVLANLLSRFAGQAGNEAALKMDEIKQVLQMELNLDLDEILDIEDNEFVKRLADDHGINKENFEAMAHLLLHLDVSAERSKNTKSKSLILLKSAHELDTTYSLERAELIQKLEGELKN